MDVLDVRDDYKHLVTFSSLFLVAAEKTGIINVQELEALCGVAALVPGLMDDSDMEPEKLNDGTGRLALNLFKKVLKNMEEMKNGSDS